MDRFLQIADEINQVEISLKKFSKFKPETRTLKIDKLLTFKLECKEILGNKELNEDVRFILIAKYKNLREIIHNCIKILKGNKPKSEEEIEEEEEEAEEEDEESAESFLSPDEETMANNKLDLNLALKLVEKFHGEAEKLSGLFEAIELLKDYSEGVPEAEIIKFLKTRLTGPAHGVINSAVTLNDAKLLLKTKFAVKLSPQAVEAEMASIKQNKLSLSEYGQKIHDLAAKLAAAHVSRGTFTDEAAADAIVQPAAIKAFTNGLKDPKAQFFLKARNPDTLTKAISDALEVNNTDGETVHMTFQQAPKYSGYNNNQHNSYRGYRGNRSYRGNRGFRGRGNYRGFDFNYSQNQHMPQHFGNRGNRGNRGNSNPRFQAHHQQRGNQHSVNVAETTPENRQANPQQP